MTRKHKEIASYGQGLLNVSHLVVIPLSCLGIWEGTVSSTYDTYLIVFQAYGTSMIGSIHTFTNNLKV